MSLGGRFGFGLGAFDDGLVQSAVLRIRLAHVAGGIEVFAAEQVHFLDVVVVSDLSPLVVGQLQHQGVKLQIQFVIQVGVFCFTGPVHAVQKRLKLGFVAFSDVLGGAFGGKAEDQGAHVVQLQHFAHRQLAHKHAPVEHGLDQPQAGEHANGLAHRSPAGAHAQRQSRLVQAFTRFELAAVDQLLELLGHKDGQAVLGLFRGGLHGEGG